MYAGRKKEFTREGTLPEPVLLTAFSREFANVRGVAPAPTRLADLRLRYMFG
jgi:hypothetical protein